MRTSSFSDQQVIALLTRYFVPVWTSSDDYGTAKKSAAETKEWLRIQEMAGRLKLGNSNIAVYLLDPEGVPLATQTVAKAMEPHNLVPFLEQAIEKYQLKPRDPQAIIAGAGPPRVPRPTTPDALLLHCTTRFLPPGESFKGAGEDFVELTAAEWAAFLPPGEARIGTTWPVPRPVAERIYQTFYPALCCYYLKSSKVIAATLTAELVAKSDKEVQVELRGSVALDHSRDDVQDGRVTAKMLGLARVDPAQKNVTSLQMISEQASFVWHYGGQAQPSRLSIVVESVK